MFSGRAIEIVSRKSILVSGPAGSFHRTSNVPAPGFGGSATSANAGSIPSVAPSCAPNLRESRPAPLSDINNMPAKPADLVIVNAESLTRYTVESPRLVIRTLQSDDGLSGTTHL